MRDLKFDVIIGNPPYQGADGQSQIYPKFVINALNNTKDYTAMIIPARWYNGYSSMLDTCREKLLEEGIQSLDDYTSSEDVFDNVQIMGGICYYSTKRGYKGKCRVTNHRKGKSNTAIRDLVCNNNKADNINIIVRDNIALSILQKVKADESFDYFVSAKDIFKISTIEKGEATNIGGLTPVFVTGNQTDFRGGTLRYFNINTNHMEIGVRHFIDKHKIFLYEASDNMLSYPFRVINKPLYGAPGQICNASFIVCGPFESEEICQNVITYLCTKFIRCLIFMRKMSQHTSRDTYKFVPIDDFTHQWNDQMLYEKYSLTNEEIDYIENNFKEI